MRDDRWIVIPAWPDLQHGSARDYPWMKLYYRLNHKAEWLDLTDAARGLQVRIWLLYGASNGVLRVSQVQAQGWSRNSARHLEQLNHAGFIQLSASKPLAQRREEKKREEPALAQKIERLPFNGPAKPDPPRMNAGAYKPFKDESEEPFDEEAWIAEVSARAHASPRRAPIQDPILTESLEPDQRMVDLAKDWLDAGR